MKNVGKVQAASFVAKNGADVSASTSVERVRKNTGVSYGYYGSVSEAFDAATAKSINEASLGVTPVVEQCVDRKTAMPQLKRPFLTKHYLSPKQREYLSKSLPHLAILPHGYVSLHPHPCLNIDREYAECLAVDMVSQHVDGLQDIVDIGGNASRHLRYGRSNIHSCNPILSPSDVFRDANHSGQALRKCNHLAEECNCVSPAAYLSVDSLYYLEPSVIAGLCIRASSHMLYAVIHEFDAAYGSFGGGEAHYMMVGPDRVSMSVNGNSQPYVHSNLAWMRTGCVAIEHPVWKSLVWRCEKITGDHKVYSFTVSEQSFSSGPATRNFTHVVYDSSYYGEVVSSLLNEKTAEVKNVVGDVITAPDVKIFSWGSWFLMWKSGVSFQLAPDRKSVV